MWKHVWREAGSAMAEHGEQTADREYVPPGPKRLFKAREGLLIDGVCSGLASYLGVGASGVRVVFVLLALAGLWGGLLYLLGMALVPRMPVQEVQQTRRESAPGRAGLRLAGYAVLILGGMLFLSEVGFYQWRFWRVWTLGFHAAWPLFVIVLGWAMLVRGGSSSPDSAQVPVLERADDERMIAGVCAGLARRLGVDTSAVRVLWAFLTVLSWGVGALAYGILVLLLPAAAAASSSPAPEKIDPAGATGPAREEEPS